MSVKVELTFNSISELKDFLGALHPAYPTPFRDNPPELVPIRASMEPIIQTEDPIKAGQKSLAEMMGRFPSGQGALKAREILGAHGLKKVAEASPETAAKLIAAFNAAQPAA